MYEDTLGELRKRFKKPHSKRESLNLFNNANIASVTRSMLVYEQQNNKFDKIKSFVRLLEDLNTLEKETNPKAKLLKEKILWELGINKKEASHLLKLVVFQGQGDALEFCKQNIFNNISETYPTTIPESDKRKLAVITGATGDIGFNIAKAFLKYGYKKYVIKVIRHANSEYLKEEKLKRENKAKKLAEGGANVELVDYNKHDELVKALTGASFVVSALGIGSRKPCYNAQINLLKAILEINERFERNEEGIKRIERFVLSEFYVDYNSIAKNSKEIIVEPFWYTFEDKKDFQEVLEKRKVVKKTKIMKKGNLIEIKIEKEELHKVNLDYFYLYAGLAYEYVAWLGFDTTTRDANFYAERDKKVSLTSFADIGRCVVEVLDNNKFVNKAIRVNGISLTLGDVCNKFVASYKKFVADKEWLDMYPFEDLTNLNSCEHEKIKVLQARNLDLGPDTLKEEELGFKLDNDLDKVIEIFVRTNAKEQLDLSHIYEFPELLNDLR
ncbi:19376_t:CDS:2 [Dentiscutata erythropus]|uniref:19376_t:CDS:1 n=1 Tax=Dentiscutata erythropus TaxID=1348616 RepID=A0A9N9A4S4_9GLOM|nr:19376_t:CDS:2 [Dentiscutata erythropus]